MKKSIKIILLLSIFPLLARADGVVDSVAMPVSIVSLLANPEKYDSKAVYVAGVSWFEFETSLICLDFDSIKYHVLHNCLKVGATTESVKLDAEDILNNYNKIYIALEGIFTKPVSETPVRKIVNGDGTVREIEYGGLLVGKIDMIRRFDKKPIIK